MSITPAVPSDAPYDPFQQGSLSTDFPLKPLTGVGAVIGQSWRAFWKEFPTIAILTLVIFGPAQAAKSYYLYATEQQESFGVALRLNLWIGGIFGALLTPAVIFALMWRFRTGNEPEIGPALRWGVRMWLRTFGYRLLTSLATIVGLILLIIPGVVIAVLLSLVGPVVAVEGGAQSNVLGRSWELARRHWGKIIGAWVVAFLIYLLMVFAVGLMFGVAMVFAQHWILATAMDCLVSISFAYLDVMLLCIYLGIIAEKAAAADLPPGALGISSPSGSYLGGESSASSESNVGADSNANAEPGVGGEANASGESTVRGDSSSGDTPA